MILQNPTNKFLLVPILVLLLFCYDSQAQELHYEPGKIFSYSYSTTSFTSSAENHVSNHDATSAGTKFNALVDITSHGSAVHFEQNNSASENHFYCELVINAAELHKLDARTRAFFLDVEHSPILLHSLQEFPLFFLLTGTGRVSKVVAHEQESLPILNLKRGILSTLQTKLLSNEAFSKKRSVGDISPETISEAEQDVIGDCHTTFEIIPKDNTATIHKKKHFDKCSVRPKKVHQMSHNNYNEPELHSGASGRHHVDLTERIVKKAILSEKYKLSPQRLRNLHASSTTKLSFQSAKVNKKRTMMKFDSWDTFVSHHSQTYDLASKSLVSQHEEDHATYEFGGLKRSVLEEKEASMLAKNMELAIGWFNDMSNHTDEATRHAAFSSVVKMMKEHPSVITAVGNFFESTNCTDALRVPIVNSLAVVNNNASFDLLMERIYKSPATSDEMKYIIVQSLAFVISPEMHLVRSLFDRISLPLLTQQDLHLVLSASASIRHYIQSHKGEISEEIAQMITVFHRMTSIASPGWEKIVFVRALGNIRYNVNVTTVVSFLHAFDDQQLQEAAISALSKLLFRETPRESAAIVIESLIECYLDQYNSLQVRTAALRVAFEHVQHLRFKQVERLVDSLLVEQNFQASDYLLTTLKAGTKESPILKEYMARMGGNESNIWHDELYFPQSHFVSLAAQKKRNIIGDIVSEVFGKDRFEIELGKCIVHKNGVGDDKFGATFKATACNVARAQWPLGAFPKVQLVANDEVRLDAQALSFKITVFRVGIDVGHKTGTWPPLVPSKKRDVNEVTTSIDLLEAETQKRSTESLAEKRAALGIVTKFGFYGPEIECPENFSVPCGLAKCVSSVEECIFIRGIQLLNTQWNFLENFDINAMRTCNPINTGTATCDYYDTASLKDWMPDGYVTNAKCACSGIFDDTDPDKPANYKYSNACVRKFLQDRLKDTTRYTTAIKNAAKLAKQNYINDTKSARDTYNKLPAQIKNPDFLEWTLRVLEAKYTLDWSSVATMLTQDWIDGYQQCCCAVQPTWFASWLSVIRFSKPDAEWCSFIGKNWETFAWCDDKRSLASLAGMKDIYFFELLEIDVLKEVFGLDPGSDGKHHLFDAFTKRSTNSFTAADMMQWQNDQSEKRFLDDVDPTKFLASCLTKNWSPVKQTKNLFHYSYSIPVYAGIFLDFFVGADLNWGFKVDASLCLLGLNAKASAGPYAGISVSAGAAISFFIVRAGVEIKATIMGATLTGSATLKFNTWPLNLCFDIDIDLVPLAIDVYAFFQIRWKIVFLGLDWGDPFKARLGGWSFGAIKKNIFNWCSKKDDPNPKPVPQAIDVDEDTPMSDVFKRNGNIKGGYQIEAGGLGTTLVTNYNDGGFMYTPYHNSDELDQFYWVASDLDSESEPQKVTVNIYPIADPPRLVVHPVIGWEDPPQPIPLDVDAQLSDVDGSETLTVAICNCFEADSDGDKIGDRCDNCPFVPNPGQEDLDGDNIGNACCGDILRAYWAFEQGMGAKARDTSGFGNHALVMGGNWDKSIFGGSLRFRRTRVVASSTEINSLHFQNALSISLWFNLTGAPSGRGQQYPLVSRYAQNQRDIHWSFYLQYSGPCIMPCSPWTLVFTIKPIVLQSWRSDPFTITGGNWTHLAVVLTKGEYGHFYVNGVNYDYHPVGIVIRQTYAGNLTSTENDVTILGDNSVQFTPNLDEIQVYHSSLSASDIQNLATTNMSMFTELWDAKYAADADNDSISDLCDNCPSRPNAAQIPVSVTTCCLRARWEYEDDGFFADTSGFGNQLNVLRGPVSPIAGKIGKGAIMLGAQLAVQTTIQADGNRQSLNFNGEATFATWFQLTTNTSLGITQALFSKQAYDASLGFYTGWEFNVGVVYTGTIAVFPTVYFTLQYTNPDQSSGTLRVPDPAKQPYNFPLKFGEWMHIAFLFEVNNTLTFWLNGVQQPSTNTTAPNHLWRSNATFTFGPGPRDGSYNFSYDGTHVYGRTLSQQEIIADMAGNPACRDTLAGKQKRESDDDLDKLCGCGLRLDQGAAFYAKGVPVVDTNSISADSLPDLAFKPANDSEGKFCFMINAISTEKNTPRKPADKHAVTGKPLTITILPINDPPQIFPTGSASFSGVNSQYWVEITDIQISDVDAYEGAIEVNVTANNAGAKLVFQPDGTLYYNFLADNQLQLRGTLFSINQALYGLTVVLPSGSGNAATVTVDVSDDGNSGYDVPFPVKKRIVYSAQKSFPSTLTGTTNYTQDAPAFNDPDPYRLIVLLSAWVNGTDYSTPTVPLEIKANDPSMLSVPVMVRLYSTFGDFIVTNPGGIVTVENDTKQIRLSGLASDVAAILPSLKYSAGGYCGDDDINVEVNDKDGNPIHSGLTSVFLRCVSNAPLLTIKNATGPEDKELLLDISIEKVDPTEILSLEIRLLPDGFKVEPAVLNKSTGVWDVLYTSNSFLPLSQQKKRDVSAAPTANIGSKDVIIDANIQQAWQWLWAPLKTPRITPPADFNGEFEIEVIGYSLDPGDVTPAATKLTMKVTFTPVNDPPLALSPATVYAFEDTPLVLNSPIPLQIRDIDVGDPNDNQWPFRVRLNRAVQLIDLGNTNYYWNYLATLFYTATGTLSLPNDPAVSTYGVNGLQIDGTLLKINTLLNQLNFTPDANSSGYFPIDIVVDDMQSIGSGGSLTYTARFVVNVQNINDPPSITTQPQAIPAFPDPQPCPLFQLSPYEYTPYVDQNTPNPDDHEPLHFCPVVASFNEDTQFTFNAIAFAITDPDWLGWEPETSGIKMQVKHGAIVINVDPLLNVSVGGASDGGDSWDFFTQGDKNKILQAISTFSYVPDKDWNGLETLVFRARDLEYEASVGVMLNVIPVNDAPQVSLMNVPYWSNVEGLNGSTSTAWMDKIVNGEEEQFNYNTSFFYPPGYSIPVMVTVFDDAQEDPNAVIEVEIITSNGQFSITGSDLLFSVGANSTNLSNARFSGPLGKVLSAISLLHVLPNSGFVDGWVTLNVTAWDLGYTGLGNEKSNSSSLQFYIENFNKNCCTRAFGGCQTNFPGYMCAVIGGTVISSCSTSCPASKNPGACCLASGTCMEQVDNRTCMVLNGVFSSSTTCAKAPICNAQDPPIRVDFPDTTQPGSTRPDIPVRDTCTTLPSFNREYMGKLWIMHNIKGDTIRIYVLTYAYARRSVYVALLNTTYGRCPNPPEWKVIYDPTCTFVLYYTELKWCDLLQCDKNPKAVTQNGVPYLLYNILVFAGTVDYASATSTTPLVATHLSPLQLFLPRRVSVAFNTVVRSSATAPPVYVLRNSTFDCKTRTLVLSTTAESPYPNGVTVGPIVRSDGTTITQTPGASRTCGLIGNSCSQDIQIQIVVPNDTDSVYIVGSETAQVTCQGGSSCTDGGKGLQNTHVISTSSVSPSLTLNNCDPSKETCGVSIASALRVSKTPAFDDLSASFTGDRFYVKFGVLASLARVVVTDIIVNKIMMCKNEDPSTFALFKTCTDANFVQLWTKENPNDSPLNISKVSFDSNLYELVFSVDATSLGTDNYTLTADLSLDLDKGRLSTEELSWIMTDFKQSADLEYTQVVPDPRPFYVDYWWVILIVILAALLLIILLVVIIVCCCKKKDTPEQTTNLEEMHKAM